MCLRLKEEDILFERKEGETRPEKPDEAEDDDEETGAKTTRHHIPQLHNLTNHVTDVNDVIRA